MVEKAVFYAEYQTMNAIGTSVEGAIEVCSFRFILARVKRSTILLLSVKNDAFTGCSKSPGGTQQHSMQNLVYSLHGNF